ncbi:MAG: PilZ domain-containing protein [Myxococcales bacterium]|nr:PilZ domain-containing protein [Myxococcales bacterium]
MEFKERRLFYRFPATLPFTLEFIGEPSMHLQSRTKNISGCGVLFTHSRPVPISTIVRLRLALPVGDDLDLYGKVVRVEEMESGRSYNIGVVFLSVSDTDINSIELACRVATVGSSE